MAELLSNPSISIAGLTLVRNCHLNVSPTIPSPPGSNAKVVLDPSMTGIGQFNLELAQPLDPDIEVTVNFTLSNHTNGSLMAVLMGAGTPTVSSDGTYSFPITPTGTSTILQFRTHANTDGELSGFSLTVPD